MAVVQPMGAVVPDADPGFVVEEANADDEIAATDELTAVAQPMGAVAPDADPGFEVEEANTEEENAATVVQPMGAVVPDADPAQSNASRKRCVIYSVFIQYSFKFNIHPYKYNLITQ